MPESKSSGAKVGITAQPDKEKQKDVDAYKPEAGPYGPEAEYIERDESTGNSPVSVTYRPAYERVVTDDPAGTPVGKDKAASDKEKAKRVDSATEEDKEAPTQ